MRFWKMLDTTLSICTCNIPNTSWPYCVIRLYVRCFQVTNLYIKWKRAPPLRTTCFLILLILNEPILYSMCRYLSRLLLYTDVTATQWSTRSNGWKINSEFLEFIELDITVILRWTVYFTGKTATCYFSCYCACYLVK